MENEYHIEDEDILNAVKFHTTGRAGMSLLEKIIYIADAIEPNRNYPGVEQLRKVAETDLDEACLLSLTNTIHFVNSEKKYLDEDTVLAQKDLERLIKNKKERLDD